MFVLFFNRLLVGIADLMPYTCGYSCYYTGCRILVDIPVITPAVWMRV